MSYYTRLVFHVRFKLWDWFCLFSRFFWFMFSLGNNTLWFHTHIRLRITLIYKVIKISREQAYLHLSYVTSVLTHEIFFPYH